MKSDGTGLVVSCCRGGMHLMRTIVVLSVMLCIASSARAVPSFQEVKGSYKKSEAVLADRHGKVIHELRIDLQGRRLDWANLQELSPSFIEAVIHSEDKRFYEHSGVDWMAAGSAAISNLFASSQRGASTITMQLVSMMDRSLKHRKARKSLEQKWDQVKAAREMEKSWTKDEILEAYLNLVTFRGEMQGITAAARGLFDKEPHGLDDTESLILASLIRSPNAPIGDVSRRACLLGAATKSGARCEGIKDLAQKALTKNYAIRRRVSLAPHVAHMLLKNGETATVSTLDGELQRFAIEALKHHLSVVIPQNVNDGAVLVVDNKTGDVLAYVGSRGDDSNPRYVDGIRAKRQAGSTLKPFLYAAAFEKRLLTSASLLDDSPLDVSTATGIYKPENYASDFKGMVSARTALASSLNVPAVRVVGLLGVESFVQKLKDLGFSELEQDDYYGPSIALGSADISLYELVNAYRTLANGGVWSEMRLTFEKAGKPKRRSFSEEAAYLVTDILSDREARSATFGLENSLSTRFWTAVKTGTSKDMRDNWCIGYSKKYTVGVWVGNFSGQPMWNVSGVTGAAPVWLEIMNWLHRFSDSNPPEMPGNVLTKRIDFKGGIEPSRAEVFREGTEIVSIARETSLENARIVYPANGTIIALDPDIPEENQLVFFEAQVSHPYFRWTLNKDTIGTVDKSVSWKPKDGKYLLAILDAQNNVVDSVQFEVRGTKSTTR
jgi:penicillin-binding protein 1C